MDLEVPRLSIDDLVDGMKAAAEPTRLRILALLEDSDLNVKDLTDILGQSQPRISRHLKLLSDAGLIERFREGSRVYFHLGTEASRGGLARRALDVLDPSDALITRDRMRAAAVRRQREETAQAYFAHHAPQWDRIRALHIPEDVVDAAIRDTLGPGPFKQLVDLGTGTGRMLELLADCYDRATGLDVNSEMLSYARSKLAKAANPRAALRHGNLYHVPIASGTADAVVMHQVLHFLVDPARAIAEAARLLAPGGRLLIVDFAQHGLEFLRDHHAHERLGFSPAVVERWLTEAGLRGLSTQELVPSGGPSAETLNVLLWLAERVPDRRHRKTRSSAALTLEETP